MIVYCAINLVTGGIYYGISKTSLAKRHREHLAAARAGKSNSKFYNSLRKHGPENFIWHEFLRCECREELCQLERAFIAREDPKLLLNVTKGGDLGTDVRPGNRDNWIANLKKSRAGRKPALGMKHTEDNIAKMKAASDKYWATQQTYNPEDVAKLSCKDARKQYGISKTHYHRLRNRMKANNL